MIFCVALYEKSRKKANGISLFIGAVKLWEWDSNKIKSPIRLKNVATVKKVCQIPPGLTKCCQTPLKVSSTPFPISVEPSFLEG